VATRSVIAAQGYTVRDFAKTPADVVTACAKLKKIGYDAVQVSAWAAMPPEEMAKILKGEGLVCCATHIGWDAVQKDPAKVAADHAILGCKHTAIGSGPNIWDAATPKTEAYWSEFAKKASEIARTLKKLGLACGYHNHAVEFEKVGKRTIMDVIIEDSDPAALTMEIDTFWVQHGGADPAAYIRKVANRIPLLHLKDFTMLNNKITMAEVGEGNMNWKSILAAAKESKVEWYIVEQDTCQRDPFESLAISLRNLRAMGLD
jgi:sugar phosphate isomerase/epimerase